MQLETPKLLQELNPGCPEGVSSQIPARAVGVSLGIWQQQGDEVPPEVGCGRERGRGDTSSLLAQLPSPKEGLSIQLDQPRLISGIMWYSPSLGSNPASSPGRPAALPTARRGAQPHFTSPLVPPGKVGAAQQHSHHAANLPSPSSPEVGAGGGPRMLHAWGHMGVWGRIPTCAGSLQVSSPQMGGWRSPSSLSLDPAPSCQILHSPPCPEAAPGSGHAEGTPSGQPSPA